MWMDWNRPPISNSKVTVELRELVESGVRVWAFDYPSYYKGDDKIAFEQKVLDHFMFRQIGQETPARWLHYFRTRIREIMPYYIQLYESVDLMKNAGDPFEAYNLREEYTESTSGASQYSTDTSDSSESTSEGTRNDQKSIDGTRTETNTDSESLTSEKRFSDTPQGQISNIDDYLTNATKDESEMNKSGQHTTADDHTETVNESSTGSVSTSSTGKTEGTASESGDKTYTLTRRGNIGVQPLGQEIKIYREALINVDMMIIADLEDLFLKVY